MNGETIGGMSGGQIKSILLKYFAWYLQSLKAGPAFRQTLWRPLAGMPMQLVWRSMQKKPNIRTGTADFCLTRSKTYSNGKIA